MIRNILKEEIKKAVKNLYNKDVDFDVIKEERFGDYASNVAMIIGEGNPKDVAEKIKSELERSESFSGAVDKIGIEGPGFLNFYLADDFLASELKKIEKPFSAKATKEKINLEFISANPTGKLHIGHGRGAFYGDVLANVLKYAGYRVEREYYINDAKASAQIKQLGKTAVGEGETYLTDYLKSKIKSLKTEELPSEDAGFLLAGEIQKDNQGFIEHDLKIKFDKWYSEEAEIYTRKMLEKNLAVLNHKKLIYEKDGAKWLKTSEFGDDEDRVVIRSDGTYSYFLADIAYHQDKVDRGFDKAIDVWGADHHGHVKRMMAVKKMLGWRGELEIMVSQMVTLKESGELKKMSKREGTAVLLEELLREVGLDAMRWFYLSKALSTHMEFDVDLAKEQSKKNPAYYVQYAHARIASILKRAGLMKKIKSCILNKKNLFVAEDKKEKNATRALVKKIIQFDEVIEDTAHDYQVHRLTSYVYELAHEFAVFYENVQVIGSGKNEPARIYLINKTQDIIKTTLNILGISAPKEM